MKQETIDKLCCPFDKNGLELTVIGQDLEGNVLEGMFVCSSCRRIYPIVKGIPIMNPDEYREAELEKPLLESWQNHLEGKTVENFRLLIGEE